MSEVGIAHVRAAIGDVVEIDESALDALRDARPDVYHRYIVMGYIVMTRDWTVCHSLRAQGSRVMTSPKKFTVGTPHSEHAWTNVVQSSVLTRIVEFCVLNVSGLLTDGMFSWVAITV